MARLDKALKVQITQITPRMPPRPHLFQVFQVIKIHFLLYFKIKILFLLYLLSYFRSSLHLTPFFFSPISPWYPSPPPTIIPLSIHRSFPHICSGRYPPSVKVWWMTR